MSIGPSSIREWLRGHELEINLSVAALLLVVFVAASVLGEGMVAGVSLLLLIFFATYSVYGYVRRKW